jgi:hypothetical protein
MQPINVRQRCLLLLRLTFPIYPQRATVDPLRHVPHEGGGCLQLTDVFWYQKWGHAMNPLFEHRRIA